MPPIQTGEEVARALARGAPVVGLESAVITHGLPRTPLGHIPRCDPPGWDPDSPANLQAARMMERLVRESGAVPATIAVVRGRLRLGLDETELDALARDERAAKASVRDLAGVIAAEGTAGTTVAASAFACALAARGEPGRGVRVLATGGIGGAHRGWAQRPDVSNDLVELARTPVCVVCSGVKSLLDVPATVEMLETLGVAVVGFRTDRFPCFVSGLSDERVPARVESVEQVAERCRIEWTALARSAAIVLCQPVDPALAIDGASLEEALDRAERTASERGVSGVARTPFVLEAVARATDGRSIEANLALLAGNARLAGRLACSMRAL